MKNFSQFTYRHIGSDSKNQDLMLKEIGCKSLKDLLKSTLPNNILQNDSLDIPFLDTEIEMLDEMSALSRTNKNFKSYIGMGYYNNITAHGVHQSLQVPRLVYCLYTLPT